MEPDLELVSGWLQGLALLLAQERAQAQALEPDLEREPVQEPEQACA